MSRELGGKKPQRQPMLSKAGIVFDKQHALKGEGRDRRAVSQNKDYENRSNFNPVRYGSKRQHGFFSPFRTVSRESRNSYLLRVTYEPNVKTNYEVNQNKVLQSSPKYSIGKSLFERRIDYGYEWRDRSLLDSPKSKESLKKKCQKSMDCKDVPRPLTTSDFMKWRHDYHQMDFSKQTSYKHEQETAATQMKNRTLDDLALNSQSHFNNMSRFSFKPRVNKAHPFESDSPHKYLEMEKEERVPMFDLEKTNWNRLKKMWDGQRANLRFDKFREKITVKQDRSEDPWVVRLEYNPRLEHIKNKLHKNINFEQCLQREPNISPSKYPMKLSQRLDYGMFHYPELQKLSMTMDNCMTDQL